MIAPNSEERRSKGKEGHYSEHSRNSLRSSQPNSYLLPPKLVTPYNSMDKLKCTARPVDDTPEITLCNRFFRKEFSGAKLLPPS